VGVEDVVLPLQRSAGNRAVGTMLAARETLARKPTGPLPTTAPERQGAGEERESGGGSKGSVHVTIAKVGSFEAHSLQLGEERRGRRDERDEKDDKKKILASITLTKSADALSPKLFQLAAEGKPLSVEIRMGSMTVRIADAMITSIQAGDGGGEAPTEQLTLSGTVEVEFTPAEGESAEGG
jgi:type VI protein secretion system component Hcp